MDEMNNVGSNIILLIVIFALMGYILTRKKK